MEQFKKEDEIVIVVSRSKLFENEELTFQGVKTAKEDNELVDRVMYNLDKHYKTMRRGSTKETDIPLSKNAELNTKFKQPIPYVVIRKGKEFFVTERLEGAGESRLHGKISMGAGGHMNALDSDMFSFNSVLNDNTQRELEEELYMETASEAFPKIIGLINDDSEPVSEVHIGILGVIELNEGDNVTVREVDQLKGEWMTLETLKSEGVYERLENWSKIVVDMF
ncbi:hypothetical protein P4639_22360 [Priestia megaterium]|uniref:hypothetical protein n=1 Tax=Priestia megaterium TaxID=1404 RepID=UPI002E20854E|nr:hypothetical protein [Priestia megaterium]